jgi:hypothetical protein
MLIRMSELRSTQLFPQGENKIFGTPDTDGLYIDGKPSVRKIYDSSPNIIPSCPFDYASENQYSNWYNLVYNPNGPSANEIYPKFGDTGMNCCADVSKIPSACLYKYKEGDHDSHKHFISIPVEDQRECPAYLPCRIGFEPECKGCNATIRSLDGICNQCKEIDCPKIGQDTNIAQWVLVSKTSGGLGYCPTGFCPGTDACLKWMSDNCVRDWTPECSAYMGSLSGQQQEEFITNSIIPGLRYGTVSESVAAAACQLQPSACSDFLQATVPYPPPSSNSAPTSNYGYSGTEVWDSVPSSNYGYCSRYQRKDMKNDDHRNLCGCYLYNDKSNYPFQDKAIGVTCDYICTSAEVPKVSDGTPVQCDESICVMDDVTINIINSKVGGGINFDQLCGNCKGGTCQCYFSDVSINDIDSLIDGGINFKQSCGGNCFLDSQNQPYPGGCPTTGCTTSETCPDGTTCSKGHCVSISGGGCSSTSPCPIGFECENGECIQKTSPSKSIIDRIIEWWEDSLTHKIIVGVVIVVIVIIIVIAAIFIFRSSSSRSTTSKSSSSSSPSTFEYGYEY